MKRGSTLVEKWVELDTTIRKVDRYERRLEGLIHRGFGGKGSPPVLCHYTTTDGLKGILRERTFWATAHADMADKKELRALDAVVDEVIAGVEKETVDPARDVLRQFRDQHPRTRAADLVMAYLRCFTAEADSLPHWESFTKSGDGICLQLRTLSEAAPSIFGPGLGLSVLPIEYDADVWRSRVRVGVVAVLDECNAFVKTAAADPKGYFRRRTVVALAQIAALASVAAKNHEYSDEKEWRHVIVPYPADRVPVRTTPAGKRYLSLPVRANGKLLFIEKVIVRGPNLDSVRSILADAGYPCDDAAMPDVLISNHS